MKVIHSPAALRQSTACGASNANAARGITHALENTFFVPRMPFLWAVVVVVVIVVVVVDFRALPFFGSIFSSDPPSRSIVFSGELELDTSLMSAARTLLTCLAVAIASCAVVIYTVLGYVLLFFSTMPRVTCTVLVIVYYTFWP